MIGTTQGGYRRDWTATLSDEEINMIDQRVAWQGAEGGYAHIQGTKPQTLAYGLNDSPVGLCAWIVEKYRTWSDCNGDVESVYTKDDLLTTVMIYWVTQTINSSTRLYYENSRTPWYFGPRRPDRRALRHRRVSQGAVDTAEVVGGTHLQHSALDRDGQRRTLRRAGEAR